VTAMTPAINGFLEPRARIGFWRGAQALGETGVEVWEGAVALSVLEVAGAPDFQAARFPDLAALDPLQIAQRVGEEHDKFLAAFHSLGPQFGLSLRYWLRRLPGQEPKIRLFLVGRSFGRTGEDAASGLGRFDELVDRSFPWAYYRLLRPGDLDPDAARAVLRMEDVLSLAEILKGEQRFAAWHDPALCGFPFYYFPIPFNPATNNMVEFCRALAQAGRGSSVVADLTLLPTGPITEVERAELGNWMKICERWGRDQRLPVPGGLYTDPRTIELAADPHAQEAAKAYRNLLDRYSGRHPKCFLYSFRILWDQAEPPERLAAALASQAVKKNAEYQICLLDRRHPAFDRALAAARWVYVSPAVCNDQIWSHQEAPETLRRLHRIVDLEEASGFFRLPIPGRNGCPGVSLDFGLLEPSGREGVSAKGVSIGRFISHGRVTGEVATFLPSDLQKHCLIVGTPGSGKTTLCFSLLAQLWEEHQTPFLVLEPAKTEYRALKRLPCFREDLLVFTVGNERISPFRFNPLEVPEGVSLSEHLSALNACFAGAFYLPDPLPMILEEALREVYYEKGWSEYGVGGENAQWEMPILEDLYHKALAVARSKSYASEVASNIRGMLETRLGSLLRGPKGRCFNTRRSVPSEVLLSAPAVLELDALNDEEKALMMLFLLVRVRQQAKRRGGTRTGLQHVTLIEEAHNVIGRSEMGDGGEHRANPKLVAVRFFTRMLAEMRAWGEGIVVADQLPTAMAPEVIKNTNIKVMHRLVAADDRKEVGAAMVFDDAQFEQAALLVPGQSFVFQEGWPKSRLVMERDIKSEHQLEPPPDDQEVRLWMEEFSGRDAMRQAYLPYSGCWDVCQRCNPQIREANERYAQQKLPAIEEAKRRERGFMATAQVEYYLGLPWSAQDRIGQHCAIVHFKEKIEPRLGSK